MIELDIPGLKTVQIEVVVSDLNGTLSMGGVIARPVRHLLRQLNRHVDIVLATADTRETVARLVRTLPVDYYRTSGTGACAEEKAALVRDLGADRVCALGNGYNDVAMFQVARLACCIVADEGASPKALAAADIVFTEPAAALRALLEPTTIVSTLRR